MNKVQTTTPNTPTGISPPEVPLGIQGTFRDTLGPQKLDGDLPPMQLQNMILLDVIEITTAMDIGTEIYSFSTLDGIPNAKYTSNLKAGHQVLVPWNMVPAYYSRLCKVDYELFFQPVKVSDCRVAVDVVANFANQSVEYNSTTLTNNNVNFQFDDPSGFLNYPVPMYWPVINTQTPATITATNTPSPGLVLKPAFLPQTRVSVFIAAPYIRNNLQPDVVKLIVWLRLKPRQVQGASAMASFYESEGQGELPQVSNYLPLPYFYEKPINNI